jgi:Uma2 family endonuclease
MYNARMLDREAPAIPEGRKLTYDDFLAIPDDGLRHEIIDGVHYVTPSPNLRHQRVVGALYLRIANHLEAHSVGEVFLAPFDVVFTKFDVVEPDLLFVSKERLEIVTEKNVEGTPDLVIEVLSESTSRRDLGMKRQMYDRAGVIEYWIADPESETIQVFRRTADRLALATTLARAAGAVLTTPLLPGLEIALFRVFG